MSFLLWQYRLWIFKHGNTLLEGFLAKIEWKSLGTQKFISFIVQSLDGLKNQKCLTERDFETNSVQFYDQKKNTYVKFISEISQT